MPWDLTFGLFPSAASSITCISEHHPMEKPSFATSSTQSLVHVNTTLEQKINSSRLAPTSYTPQGFANKTPAEARWTAEFETTQKAYATKYQYRVVLENAPWPIKPTPPVGLGRSSTFFALHHQAKSSLQKTIDGSLISPHSTVLISCRRWQHRYRRINTYSDGHIPLSSVCN